MLKKLLKYDLENVFKVLIVFYILALFFGVLTRVFLNIKDSFILSVIGQICSAITIAMIINILMNNFIRMWVRFKNNLYGDESYLTHTLPVEKRTLYVAKVLTAIISIFVSVLVIGLTLFVAYYSKENMETLKNVLLPIASIYESTIVKILFAFLFIFFLEILNVLQSGYTGIILGHRMNHNKTGFSILFGFGSYMAIQVLVVIFLLIVALFNKDVMNLFITNDVICVDVVKLILYMATFIYMFTFTLGYLVNVKLFQKGVNID